MIKICEVDGCNRPVYGQGKRGADESITRYCRKHYRWLKERGTLLPTSKSQGTVEERFWYRVDKRGSNECWNWLGTKLPKGYGVFTDATTETNKRGKTISSHRFSYKLHYGELQAGAFVLHSCDNPSCVNPAHLRSGTQSENIKEAVDKGRKTPPNECGIKNPKSKLTEEQVRFIKANPQLGHKEIGDMFGLSPNCIRGVRIGRTWTHI